MSHIEGCREEPPHLKGSTGISSVPQRLLKAVMKMEHTIVELAVIVL